MSTTKELIASYEAELQHLESQHRDHERSIESRIYMSKKEERARLAMMDWLEEAIADVEKKIERLKQQSQS